MTLRYRITRAALDGKGLHLASRDVDALETFLSWAEGQLTRLNDSGEDTDGGNAAFAGLEDDD